MSTDLTVIMENRPGTLAELGETLGAAGINIDGACGFPCQGQGVIHVLISDDDASAARRALESAGLEVRDERQVLTIDFVDRPGEGGKLFRRLANAGVNVDLTYFSTTGKLILGADDLEKAKATL